MMPISLKFFNSLTKRQQRLVTLLSDGGKHSVISIANRLIIGDPRAEIRDLRNLGIDVSDVWVKNRDNRGRHKLYFIR